MIFLNEIFFRREYIGSFNFFEVVDFFIIYARDIILGPKKQVKKFSPTFYEKWDEFPIFSIPIHQLIVKKECYVFNNFIKTLTQKNSFENDCPLGKARDINLQFTKKVPKNY